MKQRISQAASSTLLRASVAAFLALSCLGFLVSPGWTQSKLSTARLSYEVLEDAEDCPDEAAFREGVIARAGQELFARDSSAGVSVRLEKRGSRFTASIELVRTGESLGGRTLTGDSCLTVARAAELVAMLMLQEADAETIPTSESVLPAEAIEKIEERVRPTAIPAPTIASTARATPRPRVPVEITARFGRSFGLLPAASEMLAGGAQLHLGAWSFGAEVGWHRSSPTPLAGGSVLASLFAGEVAGCRRYDELGVCGIVRAGMMQSEGRNHVMNMRAATPHAAVGPRLTWDYVLTEHLALRSSVDVTGTLIRARLRVRGVPMEEWTAPWASAALGISISGRLW